MRLIDADALKLNFIAKLCGHGTCLNSTGQAEVGFMIDEAPTIDAEPVKHGEWVLGDVSPGMFTPGGNRPWICSECKTVESWMRGKPTENYCPNCGAKMDSKKKENE